MLAAKKRKLAVIEIPSNSKLKHFFTPNYSYTNFGFSIVKSNTQMISFPNDANNISDTSEKGEIVKP